MFVVFHKGKFVDFWLNSASDYGWTRRMIDGKGWNETDVEVKEYAYNRSGYEVISFDDQKNMLIMKAEKREVEIEGVIVEKEVLVVGEKWLAKDFVDIQPPEGA